MIVSKKPITIAEAKSYIKNIEEKKPLESYFKKFAKLDEKKAISLKESILSLNNPKIKEEHAVAIVDFLPETTEDINKIFNEALLTEEEANKIIELIKNV